MLSFRSFILVECTPIHVRFNFSAFQVDAMLRKLEKEIDDVDARIGNRWQLLDRDRDGKVTPEEVAAAANYLKDTIGTDGVQELISNLPKDKEGNILVEDIVKLASQTEENNEHEEVPR